MHSDTSEAIDMSVDYFRVKNTHIIHSPISLTAFYPVDSPPDEEEWAEALRLIQVLGVNENQLAYDECDVSLNGQEARRWAGVSSAGLRTPKDDATVMPTLGNIPAQAVQTPERITFSFSINGVSVEAQRLNSQSTSPATSGLVPQKKHPWQTPDGDGLRNMRMFTLAFPDEDAADEFLPIIDTWLQDMPQISWIDGTRIKHEQYTSLFGTDRIPVNRGLQVFNAKQVRNTVKLLRSRGYKSAIQIAMSWDVFISHDIIVEDLDGKMDDYWICAVVDGEPAVMANLTSHPETAAPTPPAPPRSSRGYRYAQFVFPSKNNAMEYTDRLVEWARETRNYVRLSEIILVDKHGKWSERQGTDSETENLVTNEHIERAQRSLLNPPEGEEERYMAAVLVGQHWPEWTFLDGQFARLNGDIAQYTLVSRSEVTQLVERSIG